MKRLKPFNKFYRRYEVDLWGRAGFQKNNKTVKFLHKIQKEKYDNSYNPGGTFSIRKNNVSKFKFKYKIVKKQKINFKKSTNRLFEKKKNIKQKRKQNQFLYRIDFADPQRKRAKTSLSRELFLVKTKLLKFYNNIKKNQLRRYANTSTYNIKFKASRGFTNKALLKYNSKNTLKKRLALNAFFSLVEHRLDIFLFRSNFVQTIQQARQLINHKHVLVNEKNVSHCGYILKNFDIVRLINSTEIKTHNVLLNKLNRNNVILYPPKYIYTDYRLMRSTIIFNPTVKQVPFPFSIDLRKWLGLAKHFF